jgi:hypothetical protein
VQRHFLYKWGSKQTETFSTNEREGVCRTVDLPRWVDHRAHERIGGAGGNEHIENLRKSCSSIGSRRGYVMVCRNWRGTSCPEVASGT